MATYTENYNLEKPAQTDIYNIDVFNANADKVDAALAEKAEATMLAPVEKTNKASQNYAVGAQFVYNGYLCKATAAIAAGGTIAIGTNCKTTTTETEFSEIKESLSTLWASTQFSGSVDDRIVVPRAGMYLCEIHANPASSTTALSCSIHYNGNLVTQQTSLGDGTSYSGVSLSAIITVTDTSIPIIFHASGAASNASYNRYNLIRVGDLGTRLYPTT